MVGSAAEWDFCTFAASAPADVEDLAQHITHILVQLKCVSDLVMYFLLHTYVGKDVNVSHDCCKTDLAACSQIERVQRRNVSAKPK